jgi:hypothetical protein
VAFKCFLPMEGRTPLQLHSTFCSFFRGPIRSPHPKNRCCTLSFLTSTENTTMPSPGQNGSPPGVCKPSLPPPESVHFSIFPCAGNFVFLGSSRPSSPLLTHPSWFLSTATICTIILTTNRISPSPEWTKTVPPPKNTSFLVGFALPGKCLDQRWCFI